MSAQTSQTPLDRTQEFLLVCKVRASVKCISRDITEATKEDYIKKYERMLRTGFLPENSLSRNGFYAYRAALLYGSAQDALQALRARDKAEYGSDSWKEAMRELERFESIFSRYPPDPERRHHLVGSPSFTWKSIAQNNVSDRTNQRVRHSKKRVLTQLRRIDHWREKLFESMSNQYKESMAVVALTGARPSEVSQGITVYMDQDPSGENFLSFTIKGTKLTKKNGQPVRTLRVRIEGPIGLFLAARLHATGGSALNVTSKPANLTAAMIKAGRKAFPALEQTVTPYVLRHAFASDAKRDFGEASLVALAQMLGHRSTETQQYYGYAKCASKLSTVVAVKASASVRIKHRHPANDRAASKHAVEYVLSGPSI